MEKSSDSEAIYCRLCLKDDENIDKFIEVSKNEVIHKKITKLFNFVITSTNFSSYICLECSSRINDIVEYLESVRRNQEKLKKSKKVFLKDEIVKQEEDSDVEEIECKLEESSDDAKPQIHKKTQQEEYECDICSKTFKSKPFLVVHMRKHFHHELLTFECDLCERRFHTATGLSSHKVQGHEYSVDISKYLFCELCEVKPRFESFNDMNEHYMNVHGVRGYAKCCSKKFLTKRSVVYHTEVHKRPMDFLCKLCKKIFPNKYSLRNHMTRHKPEEEKKYKCDICDKRFHLEYDVKVHVRHVHEKHGEPDKAVCVECDKTFASKVSLYIHNRRFHMNLAQPMCDSCGKQCRSKADLRSHIKSRHTDVPKTKCDVCGNMVKNMKKHMQIHEESKLNIKCEICGHETSTFKYLKLHMKIHNDDKPYICATCGQSFKRKAALNDHLSQHDGIPRHFCNYCDRTFNNSGNKFKHIKQAHPAESEKNRRYRSLKVKVAEQSTLIEPIVIQYEVDLESQG